MARRTFEQVTQTKSQIKSSQARRHPSGDDGNDELYTPHSTETTQRLIDDCDRVLDETSAA